MVKKVTKRSMDPLEVKTGKLKELFPEIISEGKIDFERLKQVLGSKVIGEKEEKYTFTWAGRKDAFKNLQATAKGTLVPDKKESVDFDRTQNIFIEGENLEVLKLLQKSYFGKVKMIYIDPPYNTGTDFIYKDNFKNGIQAYLEQTGQVNGSGEKLQTNTERNGRFHSDWLTMMYPRLFIAMNLLHEDGVIFVSIDDTEVHNLRMIMNEIFGEENFVATIPWRKRTAKGDVPYGVSQDCEWILCYAKSNFLGGYAHNRKYSRSDDFDGGWRLSDLTKQCTKSERPNSFFTLVNPRNGEKFPANPNRVWAISKDTFDDYYKKGKIVFPGDYDFLNISKPAWRVFESEDKEKNLQKYGGEKVRRSISTLLPKEVGRTEDGTKGIVKLFGSKVFPFPKPTSLIKFLIGMVPETDFMVMDFFAGSGTTAEAIFQSNLEDGGTRTFICVQMAEPTEQSTEAYQNGFKSISEIAMERIRRAGKKINKQGRGQLVNGDTDTGFKVFKLQKSHYKQWEMYEGKDAKKLTKQLELFENPLVSKYEPLDVVYECMVKEGFDLNSKVEVRKEGKNKFFHVSDGDVEMFICLNNNLKQEAVDALNLDKETPLICLDVALTDSQKTNLSLQYNLKTL